MILKSTFAALFFCVAITVACVAQKQQLDIQRVEPSFWWVGMKNQELQLLIYGKDIAVTTATLKYDGVEITRTEKTENPNYQFLYVTIQSSAKAGIVPITFQLGKKKRVINYELKNRQKSGDQFKGFDPSDVMYLLMPDRFANGDETNDWSGMREKPNRAEPFGRHGGDLKGIEDHLDYIKDLGATALWLNPVQENN
ncbi:MAG TPA: cyclomaltodextrinase N-terminal domain-containing protein, partial [Cyclobacteriaceae bacterium]